METPRSSIRSASLYAALLLLCAALYLPAVFGGRPLSVHEGRLPELSREMVTGQSDWLLPQSGGRPWLERPPLPHWFTALSMLVFGRPDAVWAARLPAAIAGGVIVCLTAAIASRWYGRRLGLLAGVVAATTYEIYQYATLAEDDVYLGAIVACCAALFVFARWSRDSETATDASLAEARPSPFGVRPIATILFFASMGLTNLAKGPLVGAVPLGLAIVLFAARERDRRTLRHYASAWGLLLFVVLTIAWPWLAWRHYPDVVDNWRYDYRGKLDGVDVPAAHAWDEPWWYYLALLPLALAPWPIAAAVGLVTTARRARAVAGGPERFLWCWALASVAVLSLPARKHHHYLVPVLAPWTILAAIGFRDACAWLFGTGRRTIPIAWGVAAACVGVGGYIQLAVAGRDARTLAQLRLLRDAASAVPADAPIYVNADLGTLDFFRLQFGLRHASRLIHNLTFLRGPAVSGRTAYVLTRARDRPFLETLGAVDDVASAEPTEAKRAVDPRYTVFRIRLDPARPLAAEPPPRVGVLEAMGRRPGPWIGAPPPGATTLPTSATGGEP